MSMVNRKEGRGCEGRGRKGGKRCGKGSWGVLTGRRGEALGKTQTLEDLEMGINRKPERSERTG